MLLKNFAKFTNWPPEIILAQEVSEGLYCFSAGENSSQFIMSKYYNYEGDIITDVDIFKICCALGKRKRNRNVFNTATAIFA